MLDDAASARRELRLNVTQEELFGAAWCHPGMLDLLLQLADMQTSLATADYESAPRVTAPLSTPARAGDGLNPLTMR